MPLRDVCSYSSFRIKWWCVIDRVLNWVSIISFNYYLHSPERYHLCQRLRGSIVDRCMIFCSQREASGRSHASWYGFRSRKVQPLRRIVSVHLSPTLISVKMTDISSLASTCGDTSLVAMAENRVTPCSPWLLYLPNEWPSMRTNV